MDQSALPAARARREGGALSQSASSFFQQLGFHVAIAFSALLDLNDDEAVDEEHDDDGVFGGEEHVGVAQDVISAARTTTT